MNKVKIIKGMEKICLAGLLTGAGLILAGKTVEKDRLSVTGAGVLAISTIGALYTNDKKRNPEYIKYLEEQEKYNQ